MKAYRWNHLFISGYITLYVGHFTIPVLGALCAIAFYTIRETYQMMHSLVPRPQREHLLDVLSAVAGAVLVAVSMYFMKL